MRTTSGSTTGRPRTDFADGRVEASASASTGPGLATLRARSWVRLTSTPLSRDAFDVTAQATATGSDRLLIEAPASDPRLTAGFFTISMNVSGAWLVELGPAAVPDTNAGTLTGSSTSHTPRGREWPLRSQATWSLSRRNEPS